MSHILTLCDDCDFVSKNQHGLSIHRGRTHINKLVMPEKVPDIIYQCEQCDFKTTYLKVLNGHTKLRHETQSVMTTKEASLRPGLEIKDSKIDDNSVKETTNMQDNKKVVPNKNVFLGIERIKICDKCEK